jgi:hypothetical protein
MKKIIFVFILLSAHLAFANSVYAETVEVISHSSGCNYFIAGGDKGYCLLKWYDGYCPSVGDFIIGDINSTGFKDVYYPLKEREGKVYVENYSMSKSRSFEIYKKLCN